MWQRGYKYYFSYNGTSIWPCIIAGQTNYVFSTLQGPFLRLNYILKFMDRSPRSEPFWLFVVICYSLIVLMKNTLSNQCNFCWPQQIYLQ